MASLPPRQLPTIRRLQRIRIHSLAGQPPSRAGQLTHLQPHRHYPCLQVVPTRLQLTGAAIQRAQHRALNRNPTINLRTHHFRLRPCTIPDTVCRTVSADSIQPRAFTRTRYHRHRKCLIMLRLGEQTPLPHGPSLTLLQSLIAKSTFHRTAALRTAKISCLMTL